MAFDRRLFMKTVAATAGASLLAPHIPSAQAATPESGVAGGQVAGVYRTKVGDLQVTSIFDGWMEMTDDILLTKNPVEAKRLKEKAFLSPDAKPGYLNTFLIHAGEKLILVDTGARDYGPGTGQLLTNLKAAGVDVAQIDEILLTHAHPDHVNGLLDQSGQKVFPRAKIRIADEELSFWFDESKKSAMPDKGGAFDAARKNLSPYKDSGQIETFKLGGDLGDGLSSVDLRGHTPGHSGFRIASGSDQFLIWGDVVHMQTYQFTHPEWALTFDIDPSQAIASRKKILDEVATDRLRIGGMHLSFPGIGHVEKVSEGYALVPQMWEAKL